jgi:multiple sugar transport system ATP-binding protein
METIVKIEVDGSILTSVVFGGVDFSMGEKVRVSFKSENNVLFDRKSSRSLATGTLV